MDGLAASYCTCRFPLLPSSLIRFDRRRPTFFIRFNRRRPTFLSLAASSPGSPSPEEPKLDKWDLMELKFGRMTGEDPKLTMAKIMARKLDPDVSYLDVEKEFRKKKGKIEIVEIPFDWDKKEVEPSNSGTNVRAPSKSLKADKGLNLVRPVMKKGIGSEEKADDVSPVAGIERNLSSQKTNTKSTSSLNVTLRKPTVSQAEDIEMEKNLKLEIKPNLYLKMRKNMLDKKNSNFGNVTMLNKPEPVVFSSNSNQENMPPADAVGPISGKANTESDSVTLLKKPEPIGISSNSNQENFSSADTHGSSSGNVSMESDNVTLLKKPEQIEISSNSNQEDLSSADAVGLGSGKATLESENVTLLKKTEPVAISLNSNQENMSSTDAAGLSFGMVSTESFDVTLSKKPESIRISLNNNEHNTSSADAVGLNSAMVNMESDDEELSDPSTILLDQDEPTGETKASEHNIGLQRPVQPVLRNSRNPEMEASISQPVDLNSVHSSSSKSFEQAALQEKPQRLDPLAIRRSDTNEAEKMDVSDGIHNHTEEVTYFRSAAPREQEEKDWARAEEIFRTGKRADVEVISSSSRGFVVLFGSLVGFLPYRNLGTRWKFLAFETWLRKKGFDPSQYRQNLSIVGNYEIQNRNLVLDSDQSPEVVQQLGDKPVENTKFEDLLEAYDKEKTKFLTSFVGQRINVSVTFADGNSRKLLFSARAREKEEITEKKRCLMAKLSIGDVVKCRITKIKYFGIFVEVEGVPALIHQSEVSWDAALDPSVFFRTGQIVEAKVHQLDFSLERITLSLKEIMPDPLVEALESLESVIGDHNSLDGSKGTMQADVEWPDVESLIDELKKIEGVDSVLKGRYFLSPGLAPTFQVYMASVLDNQYKLLARSGNKVQEVIVQASLDKEQMKAAISTCTNRVKPWKGPEL